MSSYAAIAPIAQHRGREPQLACDLDQRPTAARQQGNRLRLELIRKMTPFLAHSTPSRSRRSLAKVSTNSGETHTYTKPADWLRQHHRHQERDVRRLPPMSMRTMIPIKTKVFGTAAPAYYCHQHSS